MRHPIYTVSNSILKGDIKAKKRIKSSKFSRSIYNLQEHLEKQSERIIQSFIKGHLTLEKKQYKLFAKYIDTFALINTEKEACFARLQELADFDIKQYLSEPQRSFWGRMFSKNNDKANKTRKRLKKEMKKYVRACRRGDDVASYNIREDARMYVEAFLRDEFSVPSENVRLFKDYIHTILYPVYAGSQAEKAMQKLRAHDYETTETEKANATSKAADKAKATWGNVKGFFSKMADEIVAAPQKIKMPKMHMPKVSMPKVSMPKMSMPKVSMPKVSMPKMSMPKMSMPKMSMPKVSMPKISMPKMHMPEFKMPSFTMSEKSKRIVSRTIKVLGLAGALTFGTIWGVNKCSGNDKESLAQNKTELSETPQDNIVKTDDTTYHFEPVSNIKEPVAEVTTENAKMEELKQHKSEARIKHHRFILQKRIGSKKTMAMIAKINKKRGNDGVFSLPDSISTEDFAFAMVMYRAYGVESSLQNAYKAETKLTAEENAQIIKDIIEAGDTGLGVKKKAEQINKGPLEEGYSLYNQLSQKDQHQHNVNLAQYRLAKQLLAKSAVH